MSKCIENYVDINIPVIKEIDQKYGSALHGLNQDEKVFILARTCEMLRDLNESEVPVGGHIYSLWQRLQIELRERRDMIGFIEVLADDLLQAEPVEVVEQED